jgi:hypothetical protein
MRAFLLVAAVCFAALAAAHVLRLVLEGTGPLQSPVFILTTLLSVALSAWATVLLLRKPAPGK